MKKQLLFGAALLAAISAFPQSHRISVGTAGAVEKDWSIFKAGVNEKPTSMMAGSGIISNNGGSSSKPTQISWQLLTGSMNTYGMLVSTSRPLQYHPKLNAVSFIHRKSDFYAESPALPTSAESGVIVANISSDWGNTWDSTCIWSDPNQWGRYPQGGIYNPPTNTVLANAYVVGCGPTVSGSNFTGNWYASKQLNVFDATASTATGAQQFLSFTLPSYPPNQGPHSWSRNGFSSTDDGIVRSLGLVEDDNTALSTVRGFAVVTGTFNGTAFDWVVDTLTPNCVLKGTGTKNLSPDGQMAWNQDGTIGYVVGLGALVGRSLANAGIQPIIYKMDRTTNPAATWTLMSSIDFNDPAFRPVVISKMQSRIGLASAYTIASTVPSQVDTIGIPFFNDYDITVDANGKVHIGATFYSGSTDHPDSLYYLATYTTGINPTERYSWRHLNGSRPYLYDFYGDGTTWNYKLVDSLSSEGPDPRPGQRGFNDNPWDNTGDNGTKLNVDSRIQLGRSPDGKIVYYSWAESDTLFTNSGFKWNNLPDIKVRCMAVHAGTNTNAYALDFGPEQNMTSGNNNVSSRATLHYMSPVSSNATLTNGASNTFSADIFVPFTVTNSNPYSQLTNNATWFGGGPSNKITFRMPGTATVSTPTSTDAIGENTEILGSSYIYPNPATNQAVFAYALKQGGKVNIDVINAVGQIVRSVQVTANVGENVTPLDLTNMASGIYMVNLKTSSGAVSRKLIIE